MPTAILVDGGFFVKRYRRLFNTVSHDPATVAGNLYQNVQRHLYDKSNVRRHDLYRVFYYDCPPLTKKAHNPVSRRSIDFAKSDEAHFRLALHDELRRLRKVALRMGYLADNRAQWTIRPKQTKALLAGKLTIDQLTPDDVAYDVHQKGVDMRIGLDIASLAFKRQVDQIVLVAGDSDFVPAAKLARREGIDFVLDPMWNNVNPDLHEHIDGLRSPWPKPGNFTSKEPEEP